MPSFEITIRRHVSKLDEFKRVIDADDETDAYNIGRELAFEADRCCPDDCEETDYLELGDFYVEEIVDA
jgi:hypothetical protein